jgi:hypothetical protein
LGRAKALSASVFWAGDPEREPEYAREAIRIAEAGDDPHLLATTFLARAMSDLRDGRFEDARIWAERPLGLLDALDPERVAETFEMLVPVHAALGRLDEARASAASFEEATEALSPHHRLHGVSAPVEIAELAADWETLRELTPRVERRVEENRVTFCIRNPRNLLVCAAAHLALGDRTEAERLQSLASEMHSEGFEFVLSGPRLRLALLSGDLEEAKRVLDSIDVGSRAARHSFWFKLAAVVVSLEALAALGDRERLELEVERWQAQKGPLLEPFVMRALGQARDDARLIEGARERFAALGLGWHASQTEALF